MKKKESKTVTYTSVLSDESAPLASDEQVLRMAIEKAEKNGYNSMETVVLVNSKDFYYSIIFDHEFCKKFFGSGCVCGYEIDPDNADSWTCEKHGEVSSWQYHIAELAKSENRIDYLRKFLNE